MDEQLQRELDEAYADRRIGGIVREIVREELHKGGDPVKAFEHWMKTWDHPAGQTDSQRLTDWLTADDGLRLVKDYAAFVKLAESLAERGYQTNPPPSEAEFNAAQHNSEAEFNAAQHKQHKGIARDFSKWRTNECYSEFMNDREHLVLYISDFDASKVDFAKDSATFSGVAAELRQTGVASSEEYEQLYRQTWMKHRVEKYGEMRGSFGRGHDGTTEAVLAFNTFINGQNIEQQFDTYRQFVTALRQEGSKAEAVASPDEFNATVAQAAAREFDGWRKRYNHREGLADNQRFVEWLSTDSGAKLTRSYEQFTQAAEELHKMGYDTPPAPSQAEYAKGVQQEYQDGLEQRRR